MQKYNSIFLLIALAIGLSALLPTPASAQLFENTFGSLANNDDPQDGKPLPNGQYAVLSNTLSFSPANRIMLTTLNANGTVNTSVTIHDPASPNTAYFAAALELDYSSTGSHAGYFIAGSRAAGNGRQAVLIRTNTFGVATWVKVLPNQDNSGTLTEGGVSVERQSNGDVILTASARNPAANNYRFTLARFSAAGAQLWSHRYYTQLTGHSYEATEACNAVRAGAAVVVVTGRHWVSGSANSHTFLSCIDAATGTEFWRRTYTSGSTRDAGIDVVYKPAANNEPAALMAVGYAGQTGTALWVVRADVNNGAASAKTYLPNVFTSAFSGNAVTLDATGTRAVVTGLVSVQPSPGVLVSGTFVMLLPFYGTELPVWTYYYASSSPVTPAPRSVARVTGAAAGYFVTCGTRLTGSNFTDVHTIRTNTLGSTAANGCDRTALTIVRTPTGTSTIRDFNRVAYTWTNIQLTRTTVPVTQEFCTSPAGLTDADERTTPAQTLVTVDARLAPNPVTAGQDATISLELPIDGGVQMRVLDLTGRTVWHFAELLPAGTQVVSVPTGQWNRGTYIVQVAAGGRQQTMKLVVTQ